MPDEPPVRVEQYIPALLRTGVSANQAVLFARGDTERMSEAALSTLRTSDVAFLEGVGGVRRQNFLWQWGAISRSYALREKLGQVSPEHVPTAEEMTQGRFVRARGFQYNVDLLVRDQRSGQVYFTPMPVASSAPLSTGEALRKAVETLRHIQSQAHAAGNRDTLPITVLGPGVMTDVIERVPLLDEGDE